MPKAKRYEVLHTFAGTVNGKRTYFTRRNQDDVALLDAETRDALIANGRVREFEAPDDETEPAKLDGSLETAMASAQARATSVPVATQEAAEEGAAPARRRKKAAAE